MASRCSAASRNRAALGKTIPTAPNPAVGKPRRNFGKPRRNFLTNRMRAPMSAGAGGVGPGSVNGGGHVVDAGGVGRPADGAVGRDGRYTATRRLRDRPASVALS